jgi:hypothetical protein
LQLFSSSDVEASIEALGLVVEYFLGGSFSANPKEKKPGVMPGFSHSVRKHPFILGERVTNYFIADHY